MEQQTKRSEWSLPFEREEYLSRLACVRERMAKRGVDLLYVTSPPNLHYLMGYESCWFDGRNPTGIAVTREENPPLLFDTWDHQRQWPWDMIEDYVAIDYAGPDFYYPKGLDIVTQELHSRGWLHGRAAVERWSWAPAAPVLEELAGRLAPHCDEVVDGSFLVDSLRQVKSPKELEYVRKAIALGDLAMEAVRDTVAPGMTELEVAGLMYETMLRHGGEEPGIRTMVHAGGVPNHAPSTRRVIREGDLLMIDNCGVYNRYHGNVLRTFSIGPNPFWEDALRRAEASIPKVLERVKPGDPLAKVQQLMDAHIDEVELRDLVWWIGGYSLSAAVPPDWVGHVYLNPAETLEEFDFVPGFVTNYEHILEDRETGTGASFVETLIMTEDGIEIPSRFPRTITVVEPQR